MGDKYDLETSKEVCAILKEIVSHKQISQQELAAQMQKPYTLISKQVKPLEDKGFITLDFESRKRIYKINHSKIYSYFGMSNILDFVYAFVYHATPKTVSEAIEEYKKMKNTAGYNADIDLLKHKLQIYGKMTERQANEFNEDRKRMLDTEFYLVKLLQNKV